MNRVVLFFTLCAVLSNSWLEKVDAELTIDRDCHSMILNIETLNKLMENLETEIKMQSSMLRNLVSKEELESILLNNLATKSDMQMQEIAFQNLEAKLATEDNSLSNLQARVDELKTLLIKSSEKDDEQVTSISNLAAQSNMQTILLTKIGENLDNQTSLLNEFVTQEGMQSNKMTNMEANATTVSDGMETIAEGMENSTASKGIVEGIIAATYDGMFIIPLDTREQTEISGEVTLGVAFNWQSRKVYWIEFLVGIKIANLDGSSEELFAVEDSSSLGGLTVDQITGNVYYGSKGRIRVCDSMGKKCVTAVPREDFAQNNIRDIALYHSEGLMFWSQILQGGKKVVTRANMDGTNATVIILEDVDGLYLDEVTEKLYWTNYDGKSIGHTDLNGYNQNHLLNTTIYPNGIAVDGDTVYFGGRNPSGVYSVTSNRQVSSIANTTQSVLHFALYGRNKGFSRSNPCINSNCANLCVLIRLSYTCL